MFRRFCGKVAAISLIATVQLTLPAHPSIAAQPKRSAQGHLLVRVVDTGGVPLAGAHVLVQPAGDMASSLVARETTAATHELDRLAPGRYLVIVTRTGYAPVTREVRVASAPVDVAVQLAPASFTERVTVEGASRVDSTATRLPTTLHETPRALTVIDAGRMRQQNFRSVNDALAYVPGMTVNSYRQGGYHFYARATAWWPTTHAWTALPGSMPVAGSAPRCSAWSRR